MILWTHQSGSALPIDVARAFAVEYFDEPRVVASIRGTYDHRGEWFGVFTLVEGEAEYMLRGRLGRWTVERM